MRNVRVRSLLVALTLGCLAALTGCMKVDTDIRIHSNDTVSGAMILAFDRAILGITGQSEDEFIDELMVSSEPFSSEGASDGIFSDDSGAVTTERYRTKRFIGVKYTFSNVPLKEFTNEETDELSISHEASRFILKGEIDLSEEAIRSEIGQEIEEEGPGDLVDSDNIPADQEEEGPPASEIETEQLFASAELRFKFTFPGPVTKSNGDIDGNSVSWDLKYGEITKLEATAKDTPNGAILWTLIGVGVAVAIAASAFVLWMRHIRVAPDAPASTATLAAPFLSAQLPGSHEPHGPREPAEATPVPGPPATDSSDVDSQVWRRPT